MASAYICNIIIYKFGYWQILDLIIFLKINKSLKICRYFTILLFYLIINLQIKSGQKLLFDTKKIVE